MRVKVGLSDDCIIFAAGSPLCMFKLNTQAAMILYLTVAKPYQGWKLQGLEVTAHVLETVIFVIAMALMQVSVGTAHKGVVNFAVALHSFIIMPNCRLNH